MAMTSAVAIIIDPLALPHYAEWADGPGTNDHANEIRGRVIPSALEFIRSLDSNPNLKQAYDECVREVLKHNGIWHAIVWAGDFASIEVVEFCDLTRAEVAEASGFVVMGAVGNA